MRAALSLSLALLSACGAQVATAPAIADDAQLPDDPDAAVDEVDAPDDEELGAFGTPVKIAIAATTASEDDGTLSHDGLELVFARQNPNDGNRKDLFYSSRASLTTTFGAPVLLEISVVANSSEETPRFSADDLTLYFAKTNGGNALDIFRATRGARGSTDFDTPELVDGVNSPLTEKWFMPCDGDRFLIDVGPDVFDGVLGNGAPTKNNQLSSDNTEIGNFLTQDCLTAYFASSRDDVNNRLFQIFTAKRVSPDAAFGTPTAITDFADLGGSQEDPFLSNDQRTFLFTADLNDGNGKDLYISTR